MKYDLKSEVEKDVGRPARYSTSKSGQYNYPCPFCKAGNDRFRVQPNHGIHGHFHCSVCNRNGSLVDYLMLMRGMSKFEALSAIGWKPKDGSKLNERIFIDTPGPKSYDAPSEEWQHGANAFYHSCKEILWSDAGKNALNYLRSRGLRDDVIELAHLGYHPDEEWDYWGKVIKLRSGIVIPWIVGSDIWRLTIRDLAPGIERPYTQVSGGSNGLYLADSLGRNRPVVLVESELDAISLAQECADLVSVCATGTKEGSHTARWIATLAIQPLVLVAFDREADKGDEAATWWCSRLGKKAKRLRPLKKDANDMLKAGMDLRKWVQSAMVISSSTTVEEPLARNVELPPSLKHGQCARCKRVGEFQQDERGIWLCVCYWNPPPLPQPPLRQRAWTVEVNERGLEVYCSQCRCEAVWYTGNSAYCEKHWSIYKAKQVTR